MEINWEKIIAYVLTILFLLVFILILYESIESDKNNRYVMPNGVLCKDRIVPRGAIEFRDCNDGNTYINPETYDKKMVKNKLSFWDVLLGVNE